MTQAPTSHRELDYALAEHAFKWPFHYERCSVTGLDHRVWTLDGDRLTDGDVPEYSTNLASAFHALDGRSALIGVRWGKPEAPHSCTIALEDGRQLTVHANTVPLAIARAVLLAVNAEGT